MYCGKYAPWDHFPKNLRFPELQNPLLVLIEFFSTGDVEDHNRDLTQWRDHVVNEGYYEEKNHGPGSLLFIYDFNIKLLEAGYLLLLAHKENAWEYKGPKQEQLENEKATWAYFPDNMPKEELLNPYKTLEKIFGKISPQMYRDYLHEWSHAALYVNPIDESTMAGEIIAVYENMRKLYSASWLIYQRETGETQFADTPTIKGIVEKIDKTFEIGGINPNPTVGEESALNAIKKFICKRFKSVQMIVHLGTHQHPFTFFLLILISDDEQIPEGKISNKIEDHCRHLTKMLTLVHKSSSAKSGIEAGNRFWNTALTKGNIVYRSPDLQLPEAEEMTEDHIKQRATFHWERWGVQANSFLDGVEFYVNKKDYRLAAFLLHQVVESTLKALIQAVTGYRVQMHNLARLLKISLLITDDLRDEFNLNTIEGSQLFNLLQEAYSNARYNHAFDPDEQSVKKLIATVTYFHHIAFAIYKQFIGEYKNDTD